MNTPHPSNPASPPPGCGELAHTLPCSGDDLVGRVNAVFDSGRFYRLKFPLVSPYFREGAGVIYRAHEVERHAPPAEPVRKIKLPNRPKPTRTQ